MAVNIDRRRLGRPTTVTITQTVPVVEQTLEVIRPGQRETRTTDIGKAPEDWTWEDLRAYAVRQIETFFGDFPKEPARIAGIFRSFHSRYGRDAGPIAVTAFETYRGRWKGAPISVTRFCKGSDAYFGDVIQGQLGR